MEFISIRGARQHNLKNIDLDIPRQRLVVITGPSGSGKSSLAFDTVYAEGQRRYVESLSTYARQFMAKLDRPQVDSIDGLSPAIAIDQRAIIRSPRSTVGTITEIHDYLRLLFARAGTVHCPGCKREITVMTVQEMVDTVLSLDPGTRILVLAPVSEDARGRQRRLLQGLRRRGFVRVRVDGQVLALDGLHELDPNGPHRVEIVIDRLILRDGLRRRLTDSLELALKEADGRVRLAVVGGEELEFTAVPFCAVCNQELPHLSPQLFSFNSSVGACPRCAGVGTVEIVAPEVVVIDPGRPLFEGAVAPWAQPCLDKLRPRLQALATACGCRLERPFGELEPAIRDYLLYGGGNLPPSLAPRGRRSSPPPAFEGIIALLLRQELTAEVKRQLSAGRRSISCPRCGGARLRPEALAVRLGGYDISQVSALDTTSLRRWLERLQVSPNRMPIVAHIREHIFPRLQFLDEVGLSYLSQDRAATTLSGGEIQRLRLATQIGSGLVGVLYILDEPTVGLHQRDISRLLEILRRLRQRGNSLLVVEHDPQTIRYADHVIDMGPGAGELGGRVIFSGPPAALIKSRQSLTGDYLAGRRSLPVPLQRRQPRRGHLVIEGARANNLADITVSIPIGLFTCVTGVSGSGKSTLVLDILYRAMAHRLYGAAPPPPGSFQRLLGAEAFDAVVNVDQTPIGRTPRSNPATAVGLFNHIRGLFARVPEARARGYGASRFSFNVKGGRCEACAGEGAIRVEMHFLPDIFVTCNDCRGARFNRDTLEITYKGRNIAEVLAMTVDEALRFFASIPALKAKLALLQEVGLGYLRLGQPATTLSGGEAQRLKLARELGRRTRGRTLYLLDEPTTGLHFEDIRRLLQVLQRLVEAGNTVVVIEHHLDVIKAADCIIDLGPEGGNAGGRLVAAGSPEEVAQAPQSYTGKYLAAVLGKTGSKSS